MLAQNFISIQNNAGLPAWNVVMSPGNWIGLLLPYVFGAAAIGLLVYLVFGGLQLMTSKGDPKAIQAAQARITTSLIGFGVVFLSFALTRLIGQLLGVDIFNQVFQ